MAKISGIALRPGVSSNNRLYKPEVVALAARRMQERLATPGGRPITMRSHHGAGDDSLRIAGRITSVTLTPDGALAYEGETAPNQAGKDVDALTKKRPDGRSFLENVSIRGWWLGDVKEDGEGNSFADDLEVDGVDFTASPGVAGATVTSEALEDDEDLGESAERVLIFESAEPAGFVEEADDDDMEAADKPAGGKKPYGNVAYADPGYQKDGKKRYPIDTADHVRAAWAYINKAKNAAQYTSNQVARIKAKIKAAAKKFGIDIASKESSELQAELLEGFITSARTELGEDANEFEVALAAWRALESIDPDNADAVITDDEVESTEASASSTEEASSVPEDTETPESSEETAPTAPAAVQLSESDIDAIAAKLAEKMTPAALAEEAKPAEEAAPAPKVKITLEDLDESAFNAIKASAVESIRDEVLATGFRPERKGLVRRLGEDSGAKSQEELAKMAPEDLRKYASDLMNDVWPSIR